MQFIYSGVGRQIFQRTFADVHRSGSIVFKVRPWAAKMSSSSIPLESQERANLRQIGRDSQISLNAETLNCRVM